MEHAACKGLTHYFYPPHTCGPECPDDCQAGRKEPGRFRRIKTAKRICSQCLVKDECLEWALAVRFPYGFIAGMSERERKVEIQRRAKASILWDPCSATTSATGA